MASLYANENFPLPAVEELRRLGHDVVTTYESGRAGMAIPDDEVLAFSVAEKRILLTINRKHFIRLEGVWKFSSNRVGCDTTPMKLTEGVVNGISNRLDRCAMGTD